MLPMVDERDAAKGSVTNATFSKVDLVILAYLVNVLLLGGVLLVVDPPSDVVDMGVCCL